MSSELFLPVYRYKQTYSVIRAELSCDKCGDGSGQRFPDHHLFSAALVSVWTVIKNETLNGN